MESGPGESSPEASPALLERAVFRAGSHDDSQRDSPRMRSSVQGHDAQQRQMHMQADAPQVSCRTPVGTAADSDLLSHDDESPPLRLDLFSDAVKAITASQLTLAGMAVPHALGGSPNPPPNSVLEVPRTILAAYALVSFISFRLLELSSLM